MTITFLKDIVLAFITPSDAFNLGETHIFVPLLDHLRGRLRTSRKGRQEKTLFGQPMVIRVSKRVIHWQPRYRCIRSNDAHFSALTRVGAYSRASACTDRECQVPAKEPKWREKVPFA